MIGPPPSIPRRPRVSVIVVSYNAGGLLAECVAAVLASSPDVELIVSDNGSSDGSLAALAAAWPQEPRLIVLENRANLGFAKASNRALASARSDYLLFLNPDCLVSPGTLSGMVAYMDAHPAVGMAGCLVLDPDGTEQVASRRSIPDPWIALKRILHLDPLLGGRAGRSLNRHREPLPAEPVEVEAISGSFMFVRRRALDEVGPLDEGYFLHCEDLDWILRFHEAGWKVAFVPGIRVVHHKGACSRANPLFVERHKHRGMERFFRKHQYDRYPPLFSRLVVLGIWLHFGLKALSEGPRLLFGRKKR